MRFTLLQLALAISLTPPTAALQSIYLAIIGSSGGEGFLAFFSDSDPCADGTGFGYAPIGFHNCYQDLTILDHPNITFTGCTTSNGTLPYLNGLPTGVADNGVPALTCALVSVPPGALFAQCPYPPVNPVTRIIGGVLLLEYCS